MQRGRPRPPPRSAEGDFSPHISFVCKFPKLSANFLPVTTPLKLGFLGSGKMAAALVGGVIKSMAPQDISVTDRIPEAARDLADKHGVRQLASNAELFLNSDAIVICVKPRDALEAIESVRGQTTDKLLISIVAGLPLSRLEKAAGDGSRVIRVMPNTPALIHKGAAAYALGSRALSEDAGIVEMIFSSVGNIFAVKEDLLDAVTGLSGSGPAYVYVMVEALADAGVLMGLPRDLSLRLAAQTVVGAGEMILQTGLHPAVLKDMVASPGGTTIVGLEVLERAGIRSAFLGAVRAATERSRELGNG